MLTEVPEFQGSLQPEEFIDWLCTAEEVMQFKGVSEEMKVPLIATRLHGRADILQENKTFTYSYICR